MQQKGKVTMRFDLLVFLVLWSWKPHYSLLPAFYLASLPGIHQFACGHTNL